MENKNDVVYLGDGLYVSFDGYQFSLMANDYVKPTDKVYMNRDVFLSFQDYVKKCLRGLD